MSELIRVTWTSNDLQLCLPAMLWHNSAYLRRVTLTHRNLSVSIFCPKICTPEELMNDTDSAVLVVNSWGPPHYLTTRTAPSQEVDNNLHITNCVGYYRLAEKETKKKNFALKVFYSLIPSIMSDFQNFLSYKLHL